MTKRTLLAVLLLLVLPRVVYANDVMFGLGAMPVVLPALALWFVVGAVLKWFKRELMFFGWGGGALLLIGILSEHPEVILLAWMIYLALVFVYFLLPRQGISPAKRKLNLIFYSSFLGLVVIGGGISKLIFLHATGTFSEWAEYYADELPLFMLSFCCTCLLVGTCFYISVVERDRRPPP